MKISQGWWIAYQRKKSLEKKSIAVWCDDVLQIY